MRGDRIDVLRVEYISVYERDPLRMIILADGNTYVHRQMGLPARRVIKMGVWHALALRLDPVLREAKAQGRECKGQLQST